MRLTEKNARFCWDQSCAEAFNTLKNKLIEAPVLAYPQPEGLLILDTDASNMSILRCRELLAVVKFIKHYRMYLWGRHFLVRTEHAYLKWLINFKDPEGMLARWISVLDTYDFAIQDRPGVKHSNADGLTQQECTQCKRRQCQGRRLKSHEMKILSTYEEALDLHGEYDIW